MSEQLKYLAAVSEDAARLEQRLRLLNLYSLLSLATDEVSAAKVRLTLASK